MLMNLLYTLVQRINNKNVNISVVKSIENQLVTHKILKINTLLDRNVQKTLYTLISRVNNVNNQ